MYTYIFDGVEFKINTPPEPRVEIISQAADKTVTRHTYADGLVLEVEHTLSRFVIYSNRPLTQNSDGSYSPPGQ